MYLYNNAINAAQLSGLRPPLYHESTAAVTHQARDGIYNLKFGCKYVDPLL